MNRCGPARWARTLRALALTLPAWLASLGAPVWAQDAPPSVPVTPAAPADQALDLSVEALTARVDALATASGMDETRRALLTQLWSDALAKARVAVTWSAQRQTFARASENAPADLERNRSELAALPTPDQPADLSGLVGANLATLETALAEAETARLAADAEVARLQTERTFRSDRRRDMPPAEVAARDALGKLGPPETEPDDMEERLARRASLGAARAALEAELASYEAERQSYDDRRELLTARQDLALRRKALADARSAALTKLVESARIAQRAAEARQAEQAVAEARKSNPVLADVVGRISALSQRILELEASQGNTAKRVERIRAESRRIQGEHEQVAGKAEKLGFSNVLGLLLRRNRSDLPEASSFRERDDEEASAVAQERLVELEDERDALTDLDHWVAKRIEAVDQGSNIPDAAALARELRVQGELYRDKLDLLVAATNKQFDQLVELDGELLQLERRITDYRRFIDEHILWVPDARPARLDDLRALVPGLIALLDPTLPLALGKACLEDLFRRPVGSVGVLLVVLLGLLVRPALRRRLVLLGERARRGQGELTPSLMASGLTLVRAALLPLVLWMLGWWLRKEVSTSGLGDLLVFLSWAAAPFTLLTSLFASSGLGPLHFRWPAEACATVRRSTRGVAASVLPVLVLLGLLTLLDDNALDVSVGRLARIVLVFLLATWLHALLRPRGPVGRILAAGARTGMGPRLRFWAHLAMLLLSVSLVVLILAGYQYAAGTVLRVLGNTGMLAVALVMARGVALQGLAIQARRLRAEQRRRMRGTSSDAGEGATLDEETSLDVAVVSGQARQLMSAAIAVAFVLGAVALWSEVLPALAGLDKVIVLERSFEVTLPGPDGGAPVTSVAIDSLTLSELLGSLVGLALTVVAVRNLPGLLDIALLSHLDLQPGTGYAIKTITRYVLVFGGTAAVLSRLGVTWESMQWLVAAMSVGLGFGLQEVFANFVCGLILLFERPVRVGDIVTVSGVEGVVTRIQMRATTVRDWSRREMLIPNRRFITDDVTNWTLSDPLTRITFPVGIAYGSDTELATRTLLEVAARDERVLESPAPSVVFRGFGDSTLDFKLRAFISHFDHWPEVTHSVNTAIDKAFREQGIEIAFPQRDVHIKVKEMGAMVGGTAREEQHLAPD